MTAGDLPHPPAASSATATAATVPQDDDIAVLPSRVEHDDTQVDGPAPAPTSPPTEPARPQGKRWRWSASPSAVAMLTVAGLALGWAWSQGADADAGDTVAVLPFEVFPGGEHTSNPWPRRFPRSCPTS